MHATRKKHSASQQQRAGGVPFFRVSAQAKKTNCHLSSPGQSIFDEWAAAAAPIVIDVLVYLHVVFSRLSVFSSSFWIKSQTKTKTNSARLVS
jgi:hypothetical protein